VCSGSRHTILTRFVRLITPATIKLVVPPSTAASAVINVEGRWEAGIFSCEHNEAQTLRDTGGSDRASKLACIQGGQSLVCMFPRDEIKHTWLPRTSSTSSPHVSALELHFTLFPFTQVPLVDVSLRTTQLNSFEKVRVQCSRETAGSSVLRLFEGSRPME
jgi:hypothetical protein